MCICICIYIYTHICFVTYACHRMGRIGSNPRRVPAIQFRGRRPLGSCWEPFLESLQGDTYPGLLKALKWVIDRKQHSGSYCGYRHVTLLEALGGRGAPTVSTWGTLGRPPIGLYYWAGPHDGPLAPKIVAGYGGHGFWRQNPYPKGPSTQIQGIYPNPSLRSLI